MGYVGVTSKKSSLNLKSFRFSILRILNERRMRESDSYGVKDQKGAFLFVFQHVSQYHMLACLCADGKEPAHRESWRGLAGLKWP